MVEVALSLTWHPLFVLLHLQKLHHVLVLLVLHNRLRFLAKSTEIWRRVPAICQALLVEVWQSAVVYIVFLVKNVSLRLLLLLLDVHFLYVFSQIEVGVEV